MFGESISAITRACSRLILQNNFTAMARSEFPCSLPLSSLGKRSTVIGNSRQFGAITAVCNTAMSRQNSQLAGYEQEFSRPSWPGKTARDIQQIRSFGSLATFGQTHLISDPLLKPVSVNVEQVRTYKVRAVLKRRCKGCYYVKRQGRLFIECHLKPRHKQMQLMSKKSLFRDDYSKGNVRRAAYWGWQKKRIYWSGDHSQNDFKPLIDYSSSSVGLPH